MDQCAEFDRLVTEMDWEDVLSTLREVVGEITEDRPNPPPPSPPPVPAGLTGFDTHPHPVESLSGGHSGCIPLEAAVNLFTEADDSQIEAVIREILGDTPDPSPPSPPPPTVPAGQQNVTQSGYLNSQEGIYSQGQHNGVPVVRIPEGMAQNLRPIGVLHGEVVYRVAADTLAPSYSAAPPLNNFMSKKRRRENQPDEDRQYVKKPPNAFMLFRKEQRPNIVAKLNIKDSAVVNTILGQRWKLLTNEEKAKYYEEADKERLLHSQRHPDWSPRDNYGKKRKRNRSKAPTNIEASASTSGEVTQQAKKLCATPVQTFVRVPSTSQTGVMQPPQTLPVCNICHLPQVYESYWPGSPTTTASTALVSPAAPTETQTSEYRHLF